MLLKSGFSLLLLLAFMPMFLSIPDQNAPTRTVTFTRTPTETWSVWLTTSSLVTTQALLTQTQLNTLTSRSFSIDPTQGRSGCVYDTLPFTATKGQGVSGAFKSNIAISFYLLSDDQFNAWVNAGQCAVQLYIAKQENAGQVTLDQIIPADGKYEILFLNFSPATSAIVTAVLAAPSLMVSSITTTKIATVGVPTKITTTRAVTYVGYGTYAVNWPLRVAILVIAVLIISILVFALRRRRARRGKKQEALKQPPGVTDATFCIQCGTKLQAGTAYCQKCGAPVSNPSMSRS